MYSGDEAGRTRKRVVAMLRDMADRLEANRDPDVIQIDCNRTLDTTPRYGGPGHPRCGMLVGRDKHRETLTLVIGYAVRPDSWMERRGR